MPYGSKRSTASHCHKIHQQCALSCFERPVGTSREESNLIQSRAAVSLFPHCVCPAIVEHPVNTLTRFISIVAFGPIFAPRSGRARQEEAAVNDIIRLSGVAGVIAASVGLALGLEWLGLNGLMRLMRMHLGPVPERRA
jgi:hypothetical protein